MEKLRKYLKPCPFSKLEISTCSTARVVSMLDLIVDHCGNIVEKTKLNLLLEEDIIFINGRNVNEASAHSVEAAPLQILDSERNTSGTSKEETANKTLDSCACPIPIKGMGFQASDTPSTTLRSADSEQQ